MKIPSLFTKAPSYQRFNYKPRYYDPAKEEMAERQARIKRELEEQQGIVAEPMGGDYRDRMRGAFQKARKRSKPKEETTAIMIRLIVLLFIAIFLFAFLTWGAPVIYSLFLFIPVYIYFKFFRKNS